jgi:membrane protease YdiL (CAAX protease family)
MEVGPRLSFRDFPWRWRDVLTGYLPFFVAPAILFPMSQVFQNAPSWTWIAISYICGGWMFAYSLHVVRKRIGLPAWPRPRILVVQTLLAIPLVVVAVVTVGVVTFALHRLLGDSARGSSPIDAMVYSTNPTQWIALYTLGLVVAPLGEEPFHRGMLYNTLRQRMHWVLAAVLVSVVFALFHPYGLADRAGVFILGLFLAGFYEWRKTLVAPMVFHALVNAFAMTATFFMAAAYANSPMIGLATEGRDEGCLVVQVVPGGPAEHAGIQVGDIVSEMDVYSVREHLHIYSILQMHKVGDIIPVKYLRDGKQCSVDVTLKKRPK